MTRAVCIHPASSRKCIGCLCWLGKICPNKGKRPRQIFCYSESTSLLWISMDIFSNKSSLQIVFCLRVTFDQFDRLSRTIHNTTIRVFASQRHSDEWESKMGFSIICLTLFRFRNQQDIFHLLLLLIYSWSEKGRHNSVRIKDQHLHFKEVA